MKYFLCKLIPPRPSFAQDMSPEEAAAMQEHSAYWKDKADKGVVLAVGLVGDPKGFWGVGVLEVEDEVQLKHLTENDPAITSGHGLTYETYLMPLGVIHR